MKLIDVSAYDGQGAFKNGIHDGIRVPRERCLYRKGHRRSTLNRALWFLGHAVGRLPFMSAITQTSAARHARPMRSKAAA